MSALGQKQTFALQKVMSALPLKADMCGAHLMSAMGQKRTWCRLFDHLVGAGEQLCWHVDAKRFRGLNVDDQLEFGWQFHG
jgi:hypothetical protein